MGIDKFFEKLGMSKSEPDEAEENIEAPPADPKKQEMPEAPSGKTATIRQGAPETGRGSNVVNISGVSSLPRENSGSSLHIAHGSSAPSMKVVVIQQIGRASCRERV